MKTEEMRTIEDGTDKNEGRRRMKIRRNFENTEKKIEIL